MIFTLEKDEEESEEGYETIPASEQRKHSNDPGYETVPPKPDPGYETVPNVGQRSSPSNSKLIFIETDREKWHWPKTWPKNPQFWPYKD